MRSSQCRKVRPREQHEAATCASSTSYTLWRIGKIRNSRTELDWRTASVLPSWRKP
jgi:hypothetical protein